MKYPFQITSKEQYTSDYTKSLESPEQFWGEIAESFTWKQKWDKVLQWDFHQAEIKWYQGGVMNITENALDRHAETQPDAIALIWEPNNPLDTERKFTYKELLAEVNKCANMLKNNGVVKGDRVCIYLPMVPELAISVLACARIGAVHSVVFGGFSAQSIADRIIDAGCKLIITADGGVRGAKQVPLKPSVDEALIQCPMVERVIVLSHTHIAISMKKGRDVWWADEIDKVNQNNQSWIDAEPMQAEDMLFILYTSGSTGKPKGVVHTCAGYMIWTTYTFVNVFQYKPGEVHFCTADIGWITGHSYIIYGPLCAGGTSLMFEGIPTWPEPDRLWQICEKHDVNILYTAPTAIRSLMQLGNDYIDGYAMPELKKLGTVGEPINEEAWKWYFEKVGKSRCPIVDTWWQTETGGTLISSLAGITDSIPAWATLPLPGVKLSLLDEAGKTITAEGSGNLCIDMPWPGIMRTTYGDHERFRQTYFGIFEGKYFTGDGAMRDSKGNYRITGRVDDVLNVSGHRIGTAELENAINMHTGVVESAVVGFSHDIKGQGIYAFVIVTDIHHSEHEIKKDILETVSQIIGPIAKPDKIQIVNGLPKTRSGKIMRRILRKIAENDLENIGDTSTLLDPGIVEEIIKEKMN